MNKFAGCNRPPVCPTVLPSVLT